MKKIIPVIFLFFFLFVEGQKKFSADKKPSPKIGLSLSGGGAKGFAHVGVLKVLDSMGIKIDYISGTSMGAVIGGLYATGYTGKEIEKFILRTDFYDVLLEEKDRRENSFFNKKNDKYILNFPVIDGKISLLPKAISKGQGTFNLLKELLNDYSNINDFSKLPIPFLCTATNLENGKLKILEKGDLVASILASSAYPTLIDPVKLNDSLYIDGAITNNFPSEPLKERGIDIVIGVDLSQPLSSREEINSALEILNQVLDFKVKEETEKQYKYTDIKIHPDLKNYKATSFKEKEKILKLGYTEARKYVNVLSKLPKRKSEELQNIRIANYNYIFKIDSMKISGNNIFNKSYVKGKMKFKNNTLQTYHSINRMIENLYSTNNYKLINYKIIQKNRQNILKLTVTEDDTRLNLKLGLHYDRVMKTGILVNLTYKRFLFNNSTLSMDAVLGDSPRYYFNYFIDNGYIPGFGIYSTAMEVNMTDDYNKETLHSYKWMRNETYVQSTWRDKYAIGGGISHDYFNNIIYNQIRINENVNYINPYAFIKCDTRDDIDFATRGIFIETEAKIINPVKKNSNSEKILQIKSSLEFNFPLVYWLSFRATTALGLSFGNSLPKNYAYRFGGVFKQNINNTYPVYGLEFGSVKENNFNASSLFLQFKMLKKYFLSGHVSSLYLIEHTKTDTFVFNTLKTTGITVGYKSPFGNISLDYSKVIKTNIPLATHKNGIFNIVLGHWF